MKNINQCPICGSEKIEESSINKTLIRSKAPLITTNDYKGKFDNDSIYIATIGAPLDPSKADKHEQPVFYISNIIATHSSPNNTLGLLDPKNLSEISLEHFENLTYEFMNAEVI